MTIERHSDTAHTIKRLVNSRSDEHWMLLLSDVHYDSVYCDRKMLTRHLDLALERKASVFLNGDFLDLMGGKYDPRNSLPGGLRPEYRGSDYFDLVIDDAVKYLSKYKDLLTLYAQGNHETNVRKRQHTDPSARMVAGLQAAGSKVQLGAYAGWVRWVYQRAGERKSYYMHYHHGYGGNAPRSKGVLGVDLDTARYPDADIMLRGHDHNKWYVPVSINRINQRMNQQQRTVHHIRCGSYKQLPKKGWEVEKGFAAPRLGGWWVRIYQSEGQWKEEVQEAS